MPGRTHFGSADQPIPNLLDPVYPPGPDTAGYERRCAWRHHRRGHYAPTPNAPPMGGIVIDTAPRIISNLIVDQSVFNPAAIEKGLDRADVQGTAA